MTEIKRKNYRLIMWPLVVTLGWLLWGIPVCFALETLVLDNQDRFRLVGEYAEILNDPTGELSFQEVRNSNKFKPSPSPIPNMGMTQDVHWMRFQI